MVLFFNSYKPGHDAYFVCIIDIPFTSKEAWQETRLPSQRESVIDAYLLLIC